MRWTTTCKRSPVATTEYININQDFSSDGDSDLDSDPNPTRETGLHIAFVDPKATNEELCDALMKTQLDLAKVKLKLQDVTARFKQLQIQKPQSSLSKRQPSQTSAIQEDEVCIALHTCKFGVMNEPFIADHVFLKSRPPGVRSDAPDQWNTLKSALQGLITELYEEIPVDLHPMLLKHTFFLEMFKHKLNDQRRTIIYQLWTETASLIFKRDTRYYTHDYDRSKVSEFLAEIVFPNKGTFSKFAPILFPDRTYNMRLFLKCEHLALAIFLHLSDQTFALIGNKTCINYGKLFTQYKQIIITGLQSLKPEQWIELIACYNNNVSAWQTLQQDKDGNSSGVEEVFEESEGEDVWNEISFVMGNDGEEGGSGIQYLSMTGSSRNETHMTMAQPTTAIGQEGHTYREEQRLTSRAKAKQPQCSCNPSVPSASESPDILSNTKSLGSGSQSTAIEQEIITQQFRSRSEKQPQLANPNTAGPSHTETSAITESNIVQSATEQAVAVSEELQLANQKKGSRP